jgi:nucleotide-binding universal stress UspA family protein
MDIQKILWPSDRSQESDKSLGFAVFIARKYDAEILGVHVTHKQSFLSSLELFELNDEPVKEAFAQSEKDFESYFSSLKTGLRKRKVIFSGKILKGEPADRILKTAKRERADLILMGTRGHGLLDRMLIGSTTLEVLRKSGVPILAFKEGEKSRKAIRHVLVPLDLYQRDDSALDYAMEFAGRVGARVTVVYVLKMTGPAYAMPTVLKSILDGSSREMAKRVEEAQLRHRNSVTDPEHRLADTKIKTKVIHGINTAVTISDFASAKKVDLIVINKHSTKGIARKLLGSVTEKVIQISHCSVLTVRP